MVQFVTALNATKKIFWHYRVPCPWVEAVTIATHGFVLYPKHTNALNRLNGEEFLIVHTPSKVLQHLKCDIDTVNGWL